MLIATFSIQSSCLLFCNYLQRSSTDFSTLFNPSIDASLNHAILPWLLFVFTSPDDGMKYIRAHIFQNQLPFLGFSLTPFLLQAGLPCTSHENIYTTTKECVWWVPKSWGALIALFISLQARLYKLFRSNNKMLFRNNIIISIPFK